MLLCLQLDAAGGRPPPKRLPAAEATARRRRGVPAAKAADEVDPAGSRMPAEIV
jgi:hypothetical protein